MPKLVFIAAVLVLTLLPRAATAQTKVEIAARLIGYDLQQAVGGSSEVTPLPRINLKSGAEGRIELAREYRYPKEYNKDGKPTILRTAYIGIRIPIYVRETNGVVTYLLRVELCEREDPANPLSPVLTTTNSFQVQRPLDKAFTLEVKAPRGRTARVEFLTTRL